VRDDLDGPSSSCSHACGGWPLRAITSGIAACAAGAALATIVFRDLPGAAAMDWSRLAPAIALFVLVAGISIGLGLGGGMWLARARGGTVSPRGLMVGAALGGAAAAIAPGIYGIAGFGSLTGPYAGTANILASILLSASVFVALWAPALGRGGPRSSVARLGLALLAATICAASVGVLGWMLVTALHLVPSFASMKHTAHTVGLVPFAIVTSLGLGALGGAFVGAATSIYLSLATVIASRVIRAG
jgi:hypothetical protein